MSIFAKKQKKKKESVKNEKEFPRLSASSSRGSALSIKQAWITEKAGDLSALRKYVFIVDKKSNKSEIKKMIESIYEVKVGDVNIINAKGKTKRFGRSSGKTPNYKKSIVTLKEGHKIDIMPA